MVSEVQWEHEACYEQRRDTHCHSLCPLACNLHDAQWVQNPSEPMLYLSLVRLTVQYKYVISKTGSTDSPRARDFRANQNFLQMQRKGNGVSRNSNYQGTLLYPFLLIVLPCICPCITYSDKDEKEEKGKIRQPLFLFLSVLPYSSVSQG